MLDIIKQRRWMMSIIVLLVLLNLALIGSMMWGDRRHDDSDHRSGFEMFLKNELALSPTQIDSFKVLRERQIKQGVPLVKALRDSMDALVSQAFARRPDSARVNRLAHQLGEMHRRLDWSFYQHFAELSALCTPEQRSRLEAFAQDLTRRMWSGHKGHGRHGEGPPPEGPPPRGKHGGPDNQAPPPPDR
jgi:Spy/CpxP family protein refolding chaperone